MKGANGGLRPYLTEDELLGQHVIIAANLAPRKMKGVESRGMLLACDYTEDGKPVTTNKADNCEVC